MHSSFYDDIVSLMKTLRNLGFKHLDLEKHLKEFDFYCSENHPDSTELTYEIAENWIYSYESTSKHQLNKRVQAMKYLGRYQSGIGKDAYIPKYKIELPKSEAPYLFTDDQLSEFFEKLDLLKPSTRNPNRQLIFPVMFRLIYCCGLRSSEACKLRVSDVNFENGELSIYHSKGFKDRIVYMNLDVAELCLRFHHYYEKLLPNREYFFHAVKNNGYFLNVDIRSVFDSVLRQTSFSDDCPKKPTTHGLRHLFAVKSMKKCLETGGDFNNWIKYLSKYMGHSTSNETMYYIHLVTDLFSIYKPKLDSLVEGFGVKYVED